jgi:hypothetical protein
MPDHEHTYEERLRALDELFGSEDLRHHLRADAATLRRRYAVGEINLERGSQSRAIDFSKSAKARE